MNDMNMELVYGQEYPGTVPRTVRVQEPWAFEIRNIYVRIAGTEVVWQPCLKYTKNSDLVIVEQANRLLANYIFTNHARGKTRVAYWGHGKNLHSGNASGLREKIKMSLEGKVDWWFAYTGLSARLVEESGFPSNRITTINNSIDTRSFAAACEDVTEQEVYETKKGLGIGSDHVCLYCGGMYSDKRLSFLVESCLLIREQVHNFHMIFVGDGPLQQYVVDLCSRYDWMHYVGPKFDEERAPYFRAAKAILMPSAVGLAIIDSFIAKVPIFTTNVQTHGPEIFYLNKYKNGVMTNFDVQDYASAIAAFLRSPEQEEILRRGCAESAELYTIDNMISNFASGIKSVVSLGE